jgi:type I restriction enzyme S subunit
MQFDELSLAECAAQIVDNRGKTCPVGDAGRPLIATNCLRDATLYPTYETTRFVSEETYQTWFRGHPQPGDIIFVTKGSPGRVCLAPNPADFCIAQDMVAIRADERKVNSKYLFAVLRSEEVQRRISNMHVGTLIPHFKKGDFDKLLLPLPPRQIQEFIGDLYFDLSALIYLLHRTNTTLESIAQALFKSWFIDFDPVRAKAEGREPEGMDAETGALFPEEFEESSLGLIPKGWRIGVVEDLLVLQRGFDLPASQRTEGQFPVLAASGRNGSHFEAVVAGPGVTTGRSGVIGNVYYVHEDFWPLNTSLWVKQFKVATPAYAYQFLKTLNLKQLNAGSAVPTLNRNHVHARPALLPPQVIVEAYTAVASALLARAHANEQRANTLAAVRDTLLPRLVSGRLRLPEASKQFEEAIA